MIFFRGGEHSPHREEPTAEAELTTLRLPHDRQLVERLKKKLQEYEERWKQLNPPLSQSERLHGVKARLIDPRQSDLIDDTIAKIAVLYPLLHTGEVNLEALRQDEHAILGRAFSETRDRALSNAFRVIKDYLETGGANAQGGTGLPANEETR